MATQVLQYFKSDSQREDLNKKGWSAVDWGNAYCELTQFPGESDVDIADYIEVLLDHDMIRHTMTIDSNDLEEIFHIGNIGPNSKLEIHSTAKSISVGDILVDTETGVGHMVAETGFIGIAPAIIEFIKERTAVWEMA